MKIYLDDVREAPEGWKVARNFREFVSLIDEATKIGEAIEEISFDNDLGEGEMEGRDIVKWFVEHHPEYVVGETRLRSHSSNIAAREAIEGFIASCRENKEAVVAMKERAHPFGEPEKR